MSRISPKYTLSNEPLRPSTTSLPVTAQLYAFWKFSRPHTVIGTSLSVISLYLVAIAIASNTVPSTLGQTSDSTGILPLFPSVVTLLIGWVACLCGNVYIVGLNQLEDVAIDRVNKPHLPLAAGEFSPVQGSAIVAITGVLALLLAIAGGPFLLATVGLSLLIGTAYSLPPIRLKRFPFWASFCILTVRGVIVNLGLFLHFSHPHDWSSPIASLALALFRLPPSVFALTLFVLVFTFAIAIFKDVPDMDGDRRYNISTFTLWLGKQTVFNLARGTLTVAYLGMMIAGVIGLPAVNGGILVSTHGVAVVSLWLRSRAVNLRDKRAISQFYQFIWKLFFVEYLIFPAACFGTWLH